ncbi:hypothetical protein [Candidatus Puniceispirillum marinum]|uniref:Uncharacterized protein n=1 Tax=Puniceispirillum marinum (strain IMCC1322) TaxID=488538 RepID=D5BTG8_PUNMI|nr:hypothetical protein [Candidatus Puniceispirillum marinum]ADE39565.1 hypothetical protein SAR116_1322 [Candidatus Puniceispirillum marinum IMCC1322]
MSDRERSKSTASNADERLASALRENLFRRKAQARARAHSGDTAKASSHNTISDDRQSSDAESDMKG